MITIEGATIQRQGYRCAKCRARFRIDMLVNISIDRYVAQMKALRCPSCGSRKLYLGEGRTLAEDRSDRQVHGTESERLAHWRVEGEVGTSSAAIADHMSGRTAVAGPPSDVDDLRRCMLLLDRIPEWAPRMIEMAVHPDWNLIAHGWTDLARTYLDESPGMDGAAPATAAMMHEFAA